MTVHVCDLYDATRVGGESQVAGIARKHASKLPCDADFYSKFLGNRIGGGNHLRRALRATHFLDANAIPTPVTRGKRLHKSWK
jgi:hypothetical protein